MFSRLIDRIVLVRSNMSGVWIGTLQHAAAGHDGVDVLLSGASKIHYWEGAEATSGLALRGPGEGSRVCEELDTAIVSGCCEVLLCAPAAAERLHDLVRWRV